jgi:hypothetical protein
MVSPMWPQLSPPHPPPIILKSWFCTISEVIYVNLNYTGWVVIQKKIFEDFFHWNTHSFEYCGPFRPPGILINLILHSVRKLSCKFKLFWTIGSWEQDFFNFIFAFLLLSPLWWGSVPLSKQTWIPFMPG